MRQPLQGVDSNYVAALQKRVEHGVVLGTAVVFAEEVVLAPHYRRPLATLHGVIVYLVPSVERVPAQTGS